MPKDPPAEIEAAIDTLLGGFNKKDAALYSSAFTADAVVVDGMAPYRWTGPNSPGRWFADAERWAHELGVADESLGDQKDVHAEVAGARAYVALSATLSFKLKGQPHSRPGILTFTLANQGGEWKIDAQAWGRLS
jgi:ketosteroid isomerase-like protein